MSSVTTESDDEIRERIANYVRQRDAVDADREQYNLAADRKIAAFDHLIAGYTALLPANEAATITTSTKPPEDAYEPRADSLNDHVLRVLKERPGEWKSLRQILRLLQDKDWAPGGENPLSHMRNQVPKLVNTPGVERQTRTGSTAYYRYVDPTTQETHDD